MQEYTALMNAIAILDHARGNQPVFSPAWEFLNHAAIYLKSQANDVMRGERS